ncbi:MAG: type IV pilus modification PilV family protein [Gammaproteobacteria bacterium]
MSTRHGQVGLSLVELVSSMVILSIALGGILLTINDAIRRSADPMIQEQASSVAQAYLEEVAAKPFCDPDYSSDCPVACTVSACGTCAGAIGPVETRAIFDDICDYNGLSNTGARDQFDNPMAALSAYTVNVAVTSTGEALNGLDSNAGQVARIRVNVSHAGLPAPVVISTYRANY